MQTDKYSSLFFAVIIIFTTAHWTEWYIAKMGFYYKLIFLPNSIACLCVWRNWWYTRNIACFILVNPPSPLICQPLWYLCFIRIFNLKTCPQS